MTTKREFSFAKSGPRYSRAQTYKRINTLLVGMQKRNEFNTAICVEGIDIRSKTSYLHVFRPLSSVSSEINATVFLSNRFHDSSVRGHIWRRSSELELATLHRLHNKSE